MPQLPDRNDEIQNAMKAAQTLHDPLRGMREAMKAAQELSDPTRQMQEAMKSFEMLSDPLKGMREAMKALQVGDLAQAISQRAWPLAYEVLDSEIVIHDDKTVQIDSTTYTHSQIQNLIDEVANRAISQSTERVEQAVVALIAEIAKLKNPTLEKLLTWLIFPIIVATIFSIINPVADFYIKNALDVNERQLKKDIRKQVLSSMNDSTPLDSYRFVSTKGLEVHIKPSGKSPLLGQLHFGQAVFLVEKDDAWSLVAWHDDEGRVELQGWVFSRYLSKFR